MNKINDNLCILASNDELPHNCIYNFDDVLNYICEFMQSMKNN